MLGAVRVSLSWMTVLPGGRVGVPDTRMAGRAMTVLPVVGLVCGLVATAFAHGVHALGGGALLSGLAGMAAVLALTRGMHVDALADTADALGSYAGPERALEIMRSGSIGPMGSAVLALTILAEVAALGALVDSGAWLAPLATFVVSRCLPVVLLRRGVPAASPTGFGAMVAGSQSRVAVVGIGLLCVVAGAGLAGTGPLPESWWRPIVGAALGLAAYLATAVAGRHVVRRLRGINGDVLGAAIETGTAATLVAAVLLL